MIVGVVRGRVIVSRTRTIRTAQELAALGRVPLLWSLTPEAPLLLELPELTKAERQAWETRLNREWTACGCRTGEIAAILAIAAYLAALFLSMVPGHSAWGHVGWAALAALVGAAVGKVLGRSRSLARFRELTGALREQLEHRESWPGNAFTGNDSFYSTLGCRAQVADPRDPP